MPVKSKHRQQENLPTHKELNNWPEKQTASDKTVKKSCRNCKENGWNLSLPQDNVHLVSSDCKICKDSTLQSGRSHKNVTQWFVDNHFEASSVTLWPSTSWFPEVKKDHTVFPLGLFEGWGVVEGHDGCKERCPTRNPMVEETLGYLDKRLELGGQLKRFGRICIAANGFMRPSSQLAPRCHSRLVYP